MKYTKITQVSVQALLFMCYLLVRKLVRESGLSKQFIYLHHAECELLWLEDDVQCTL